MASASYLVMSRCNWKSEFMVMWKRRTLVAEPGAWSQSDSFGAEDFGHVPEGFVEPEIFVDAFDGPTLGHPASAGQAARPVALTATDYVFLNRVQGGPKIPGPVSEASRIEEHRRADRSLVRILPPVSCRAHGQGKAFRIS